MQMVEYAQHKHPCRTHYWINIRDSPIRWCRDCGTIEKDNGRVYEHPKIYRVWPSQGPKDCEVCGEGELRPDYDE